MTVGIVLLIIGVLVLVVALYGVRENLQLREAIEDKFQNVDRESLDYVWFRLYRGKYEMFWALLSVALFVAVLQIVGGLWIIL